MVYKTNQIYIDILRNFLDKMQGENNLKHHHGNLKFARKKPCSQKKRLAIKPKY